MMKKHESFEDKDFSLKRTFIYSFQTKKMGKGEGKREGQGLATTTKCNCLIGALLCCIGCWPCAIYYWMCKDKDEGETAQ